MLDVNLWGVKGLEVTCVNPHPQMRHKSEIQKLWFLHNEIEDNIGFKVAKEICLYHN